MLKAAAQGTIARLHGSRSLNYAVQKYITRSIELDDEQFRIKLQLYARRHINNCFRSHFTNGDRLNVLELGTGWYPVIPIAFYLCGASKIWTIDKQLLLTTENVKKTVQLFVDFVRRQELQALLPQFQADRVGALVCVSEECATLPPGEMLAKLNIDVLLRDARRMGLEECSVDFFFSNSVLQEIPEQILSAIFAEFRRLASPTGTMSHYINMVEPYACDDPHLTPFHFLQYSDTAWKWLNNSLHYHNRLRIPDYRKVHELAGFRITDEHNEQGTQEDLNKVRLAEKFERYSHNDLLVLRSWIVSSLRN